MNNDIIVVTHQLGDIGTNCYIVANTKTREAIVIDPADNGEFICKQLKEQNFILKAILLTHGHFDHIGALGYIKSQHPEIKSYACKDEKDILSNPKLNLSVSFGEPITEYADVYLGDMEKIELLDTEIKCIQVSGHTKGGMCYYFSACDMLFSGDTLFAGSVGRADFPTGDEKQLIKDIKEKLLVLPPVTRVYPGHNNKSTIGREKETNPFLGDF